jgi:hypothetical protein
MALVVDANVAVHYTLKPEGAAISPVDGDAWKSETLREELTGGHL